MTASIFISYRRSDSPSATGRLQDALVGHFGRERVFVDVKDLVDGVKYKDAIDEALRDCAVMIVVIGPDWLASEDAEGKRRIDHRDDIVRHELTTAFTRKIPVIPVLVDGAALPRADELPASLRELPDRQARQLVYERWQADIGDLIEALQSRYGIAPLQGAGEAQVEGQAASGADATALGGGSRAEGLARGKRLAVRLKVPLYVLAALVAAASGAWILATWRNDSDTRAGFAGSDDVGEEVGNISTSLMGTWHDFDDDGDSENEIEISDLEEELGIEIWIDSLDGELAGSGHLEGRTLFFDYEGKLEGRGISGSGELALAADADEVDCLLDDHEGKHVISFKATRAP